jgi:para-aminobenzoate synthetase component 2
VEPGSFLDELVRTRTSAALVMGLLHHRDCRSTPCMFHPESVLTEGGHRILANWLALCGDDEAPGRAEGLAPRVTD